MNFTITKLLNRLYLSEIVRFIEKSNLKQILEQTWHKHHMKLPSVTPVLASQISRNGLRSSTISGGGH